LSSAFASKRFTDEFAALLDRVVKVTTLHGSYQGRLLAYSPTDYSLWVSDARDDKGELLSKVFLAGQSVVRIELVESGPDMTKLVDRLNRLFPNLVNYLRESDTILVMDRIRVTREGVTGEGPAAEKVKRIFDEFMKDEASKKT